MEGEQFEIVPPRCREKIFLEFRKQSILKECRDSYLFYFVGEKKQTFEAPFKYSLAMFQKPKFVWKSKINIYYLRECGLKIIKIFFFGKK